VKKQPKGLTFTRSYEPDKERMLRALRVLLESEPSIRNRDSGRERVVRTAFQ